MNKEKIVHKTLKQMQYEWKDELVNELYGENFYLIEECNKQKEVLDKIKEYIKDNACYDKDIKQCCRDLLTDDCDYILELLEEIE